MADNTHLDILKNGVRHWNQWREDNPDIVPNLSDADLSDFTLSGANFEKAELHNVILPLNLDEVNFAYASLYNVRAVNTQNQITRGERPQPDGATAPFFVKNKVNLSGASLIKANFHGVHLRGVKLERANLSGAKLTSANMGEGSLKEAILNHTYMDNTHLAEADLTGATLHKADLYTAELGNATLYNADLTDAILEETVLNRANLTGANLSNANLTKASLVGTNFEHANLDGCNVYGISAWDLQLDNATQTNLTISKDELSEISVKDEKPGVSVDDIEVAQFIYLLINNQKIRKIINTVTSKSVLILGRFYKERKQVLDALRDNLRTKDLAPIVFDFEPSENRNLTETVQWLASMSKFVIADVTDAKSIPQELSVIIPNFPSVPVLPILLEGEYEYSMFEHWENFPSVLDIYKYKSKDDLIANIDTAILEPVEQWKAKKNEVKDLEEEIKRLREENERLKGK